ncbi:MAG: aminotransferase class I/II-fold pyridoxal phosphate-dependent enzyme [Saccharofermentanales bacterium]
MIREYKLNQEKTPLFDALLEYRKQRMVSFDVPGHKQGRGNPELTEFLGKYAMSVDVNSMKMLDNLIHPVGVIKEAQELAADAFGAYSAFFMTNGTTSAVQAMVLATVDPGEKIIMPRNVHRSAINALILSRAIPVYVDPGVNEKLGIPLGMSIGNIEKAIRENPEAKAILVNNPTYYGICPNLKAIVELAHQAGMKVLVDEAHGTHFYFERKGPISAMDAGADLAAISTHKTGGSLTQSSILLSGPGMADEQGYLRQIINLTLTTSSSYLLLSSLDITRKYLALQGENIYQRVSEYANYARKEINNIGGFYAFGKNEIDHDAFYDFDQTKLSIHTRDIGLAGIEVYDILRDEYQIQIEFGDLGNVLAILSIGDRPVAIERLLGALSDIKRRYGKKADQIAVNEYNQPKVVMSPAKAFYAKSKQIPLDQTVGKVCTEFVMCYPPGIPILAPGEEITPEVLEYINYAKEKGSSMTGAEDLATEKLNVIDQL